MRLCASDLSVIIPISPGETCQARLLEDLSLFARECEIIIQEGVGRALALNLGAARATRKTLWFLHADSRLQPETTQNLLQSFEASSLNYFILRFDGKNPLLRLNEAGARFRSRILKLPFGDQGFCLSRDLFSQLGGFDEKAKLGEDHLLVWKARHLKVPLNEIPATLETSSRKYERKGWGRTTLSHAYWTIRQSVEVNLMGKNK